VDPVEIGKKKSLDRLSEALVERRTNRLGPFKSTTQRTTQMRRLRDKLTYANVMVTFLAFIVLGGGAYAATKLQKNSVGTAQLKNGAVTGVKVKDGSLVYGDFASGQIPAGPQGAKGELGEKGSRGPKGEAGKRGEPGPLLETLPSGKTLRGVYNLEGHYIEGFRPVKEISYQFPLESAPELHLLPLGDSPTTECPGSPKEPKALPGNLCVYELSNENANLRLSALPELARLGAYLEARPNEGENYGSDGSWAVSAP
jgi:hypothetical protein